MTRQELEDLLDFHDVQPDEEIWTARERSGRTALNEILTVRREDGDVIITHS